METYPIQRRKNLVELKDIIEPGKEVFLPGTFRPEMEILIEQIKAAKAGGNEIVWSLGGHVIKCGLSKYLIELIKNGWITHLAGNGAVSIHDFELAFNGGTSEDVQTNLATGTYGMWEETGRMMNEAINEGSKHWYGYGESLAVCIKQFPDDFPFKDICVLYNAWLKGIPATYHIAIGTDFIHTHPSVHFMAIGQTSGRDFKRYCKTIKNLNGGVFLNFGSAIIGPEVFLKALSVARNERINSHFTTANFDLYGQYRTRVNIVERPVSTGGMGFDFRLDHRTSIPYLYNRLMEV